MKRVFVAFVFALLLTGNLGVILAQGDVGPLPRIEEYLNTQAEEGLLKGSVLIAQDGEILLSQGYGMANLAWDNPNTPDTKFRIASITKQFTAMAILLLQERGSLSVQDPICQYLEECPETWQDITIHHLLTHTSGIPDPRVSQEEEMLPIRPYQIIDRFIDEPLDFSPGEEWSYSNSGYQILGYIVEEVSGDSYSKFLQENFFEPLGMADTGYEGALRNIIERYAEGYRNDQTRAAYYDMSNEFAAGGLYSTVEDLYLWMQALHNGEVVSQESWDMMLEAAVSIDEETAYGYGLFIDSTDGRSTIGHPGTMPGFQGMQTHWTDDNVTIVILSNFDEVGIYLYPEILANMLLGED